MSQYPGLIPSGWYAQTSGNYSATAEAVFLYFAAFKQKTIQPTVFRFYRHPVSSGYTPIGILNDIAASGFTVTSGTQIVTNGTFDLKYIEVSG